MLATPYLSLGLVCNRVFDVYWGKDTDAKFDAPDNDPAYSKLLHTLESEIAIDCAIEDTPFLRGKSVAGTSLSETDLYLWMYSSQQMLGMSVATSGPAVAWLMLTLAKKP